MSLALEHLPSLCKGPPCITTTTNKQREKDVYLHFVLYTCVPEKDHFAKIIKVLLLTFDLSLVLISLASHWL